MSVYMFTVGLSHFSEVLPERRCHRVLWSCYQIQICIAERGQWCRGRRLQRNQRRWKRLLKGQVQPMWPGWIARWQS